MSKRKSSRPTNLTAQPKRVCDACGEKKAVRAFPKESSTCTLCTDAAKAIVEKSLAIDPSMKAELASRELARRSYLRFIARIKPHLKIGWVHVDMAVRLQRFMEAVERNESPRLLIRLPPRHGKSEFSSRDFPPFVLGKHPDWEFIQAAYASSLSEEFSREVRDTVRSLEYQALFPGTNLHAEFQAIDAWRTDKGGGYVAAGVGGGVVGKGAHVFIIDDPIKNAEEAESQLVRDNTWRWFTSVAMTRLAPGAGMLIVMTSWHDDDISCRAMELETENYELVVYKAIAEEDEWLPIEGNEHLLPFAKETTETKLLIRYKGEALHPDRYGEEELEKRKRVLTEREWSALYQGNPIPEGGNMFKKEYFITRKKPEAHYYRPVTLQAWDFAITEKEQSNWNVGTTGLLIPGDELVVTGITRFRSQDTYDIAHAIWDFTEQHRTHDMIVGVEDGQIWKGVESTWKRDASHHKPVSVHLLTPLTDKMLRAKPLQARMEKRRLSFLEGLDLYEIVMRELLRFPGGKWNDIVDSLSWLARLALEIEPPRIRNVPKRKAEESWKERVKRESRKLRGTTFMSS